jgi:hypothetical protein
MSAIGIALAARIRARRRVESLRQHPAISGRHVITTARDVAGSDVFCVATCTCRWRSRVEIREIADQDVAIDAHLRDVIAAAAGVVAA